MLSHKQQTPYRENQKENRLNRRKNLEILKSFQLIGVRIICHLLFAALSYGFFELSLKEKRFHFFIINSCLVL